MPKSHPQNPPSIFWECEDDNGNITEYEFPTRWSICPRCEGRGVHDHQCFSNGITGSEWTELTMGDPDFPERYYQGDFDVTCTECKGLRVVPEINHEAIDPMLLERYYQEEADYEAEKASEQRMRALGIQW